MRSLLVISSLFLWACDPVPPQFLEVLPPNDSADSLGPYQITALLAGSVSWLELSWWNDRGGQGEAIRMEREGRAWRGEIPTQPPSTQVAFSLKASGPGGEAHWGDHVFLILPEDPSCELDGECRGEQICREGRCEIPPERCQRDEDCAQDSHCPEPGDLCRPRAEICERDEDCAEDAHCEGGLCLSGFREAKARIPYSNHEPEMRSC